MENHTDPGREELDDLLERSRITLAEPDDVNGQVQRLLADIRDSEPIVRGDFGRGRRIAAGIALGAVLVGVGVAAAAAAGLWSPWAEHPDLSYQFTLPSGQSCEVRYGLMSTSPGAGPIDSSQLDAGLSDWLTSTDVLAQADVAGAVKAFEAGEIPTFAARLSDDGAVTIQPETRANSMTEDELYASAVEYAVADVINTEVGARGLAGIAYATESSCAEAVQ